MPIGPVFVQTFLSINNFHVDGSGAGGFNFQDLWSSSVIEVVDPLPSTKQSMKKKMSRAKRG